MYHYKGALKIGQVNKFLIEVDHEVLPATIGSDSIAIRVKNTTSALMRPALMAGPYILYTSVREQSYRHDTALGKGDFPPHFDPNVKTNCSRWQSIPICSPPDRELKSRIFVVEVASQIIFSPSATIHFELTIGQNKTEVRHLARHGHVLEASTPGFTVKMEDTSTIWDMPPIQRDHPGHHVLSTPKAAASPSVKYDADGKAYDHLVVLTHGIHSNLTNDMLYLKEIIEKTANKNRERVICKGFAGNACNTERGVKWLAENVGEWLLGETGWTCDGDKVVRGPNPYRRISFIAHSLGGLVQMYVLGYLHDKTHGRIFNPKEGGLEPIHYITLATPWLGISAENPAYVKLALDFGFVGKTGQDLGLTTKPLGEYHVYDPRTSGNPDHQVGSRATVKSREPLLKLLSHPTTPSHIAMRLFKTRTIYANIENDGIVPLRTSSLFFLDWEEFSAQKAKVLKKLNAQKHENEAKQPDSSLDDDIQGMTLGGKDSAAHSKPNGPKEAASVDSRNSSKQPHDYSSSDEPDAESNSSSQSAQRMFLESESDPMSGDSNNHNEDSAPKVSIQPDTLQDHREQTQASHGHSASHSISKLLSVAHAVSFAGMIRRASGSRVTSRSSLKDEGKVDKDIADDHSENDELPSTLNSPSTKDQVKRKPDISGPSDLIEYASHGHNGLLGLLKPNQTHRKPSRAFTRSQTIPKAGEGEEDDDKVHPEEPSKTSFFRSLESVLNPPMPELDYITDPAHREPPETVIVHDKFYYPDDIPPLKALPPRTPEKNQTHSEKKAEDKEHVRLEKIRLEETIAREWHKDMSFRKVLVKLKPDAHNNIIVRRMYPNCFGWPVLDHLAEHHFGPSSQQNADTHDCRSTSYEKASAESRQSIEEEQHPDRGHHDAYTDRNFDVGSREGGKSV